MILLLSDKKNYQKDKCRIRSVYFVLLSLGSQCQSIRNAAEGPDIMCNMHALKALQITFSIFQIKPIFELWWFLQFMALAIFQMCNITAQGYRNSLPQKTPTWKNNVFTSKFSIHGTDISKEVISFTLVILKYKSIKIHLTWSSIPFLACEISHHIIPTLCRDGFIAVYAKGRIYTDSQSVSQLGSEWQA